jgi:general stress protein CsbA
MSTSTYDAFFKEIPGGYLFRAPNPWVFGPGRHYFANQAQRAEILELGRVRHPVIRAVVFAFILVACPLASTLLVYLFSGRAEPGGTDIGAIAILAVVSLIASLLVATQLRLRRLAPILMRLPRTKASLTLRDIQASQVKATPLKALFATGALFTASAVVQAIALAFIVGMDVGARRHVAIGSSQLLLFGLMLLQSAVAALFFKRAASRLSDTFMPSS